MSGKGTNFVVAEQELKALKDLHQDKISNELIAREPC